MVAYSYRERFVPLIESGVKRQTMRNERKRHAFEGETIQHYFAMRSRACRLIGTATCIGVEPVTVYFERESRAAAVGISHYALITGEKDLNGFAVRDGFRDWTDLEDFWRHDHPEAVAGGNWTGVLIRWGKITLASTGVRIDAG
jgi:hypothetical protein